MDQNMHLRLVAARKRLAEIDEELMDENVTRDLRHFKEISKERANIEPQVELFNR